MRSKLGSVSHARCFRPARRICSLTTEYPMKDASPEEPSDEGSLLSFVTPFGSCSCALFHFAYILFSTPNSLPSIGCALFRKTRGGMGFFPFWFTQRDLREGISSQACPEPSRRVTAFPCSVVQSSAWENEPCAWKAPFSGASFSSPLFSS